MTEETSSEAQKRASLNVKEGCLKVDEPDYAFILALIVMLVFAALVALQRFDAAAVLGPFAGQAWDRYFKRRDNQQSGG